jgi:hypothetical protein
LKTIRVSDTIHNKLTRSLGEMMAKTGKPQTYNDIISVLTDQAVIMPAELLEKIDVVINARQLGCKTREKFVEDAVTLMLQNYYGKSEQESSSIEE